MAVSGAGRGVEGEVAAVEPRLLEYFLAVIDNGGISKAAQAVYVAQPSLSQAMRSLEQQVGVRLFERTGRGLSPTADGRALEVVARRVRDDVAAARAAVHAVRDARAGRLEVAAMPPLDIDPLPRLARTLQVMHPGLLLAVTDARDATEVVDEVRRGRAELGLVELPVAPSTLRVRLLETVEIVLIAAPHLIARWPDPVPLALLADFPLVRIGGRGPMPGAPGRVVVECDHGHAAWELVREGVGAVFLPRRIAEEHLGDVAVRSTLPRLERSIGMVHRPKALSPAALTFLRIAGVEEAGG